jgi:anti-sigma regulatory factor (Ser/Thr protein kinase)
VTPSEPPEPAPEFRSTGRGWPVLTRHELPASPASAGLARALVRGALAACPPELVHVAELLVSELVTNTVLHGQSPARLGVSTADGRVLVVVGDSSSAPPRMAAAGTEDVGGRGLFLVDTLASSWGWSVTASGKDIWFELDA